MMKDQKQINLFLYKLNKNIYDEQKIKDNKPTFKNFKTKNQLLKIKYTNQYNIEQKYKNMF